MAADRLYRPYPQALPEGSLRGQDISSSPEMFGAAEARSQAALAQGLAPWADVLTRHGKIMQDMDNETAAKEADIAFSKAATDLAFNPEKGYYTLTGKNAYAALQPTLTKLDELRAQYGAGLNDRALAMFDEVAQRRILQHTQGMSDHAGDERRQWISDTATARIANEVAGVLPYYNDDAKFGVALSTIMEEVRDQGDFLGWDEEQKEAAYRDASAKAWQMRLDRVAQDSPEAAWALLEKNRDTIPAAAQLASGDIIRAARADAEARAREEQSSLRAVVEANKADWFTDVRVNGVIPAMAEPAIRAAYADHPEIADAMIGELRREAEIYPRKKLIGVMTPPQQEELLADLWPEGPHAAEEAQQRAESAQLITQDRELLAKDPAAHALMNNGRVVAAWEAAADGDPAKVALAVAESDQFQISKGLAPWETRIFSDTAAKTMVGQFAYLSTSTPGGATGGEGALAAAQKIDEIMRSFGPASGRAIAELVAHGLPKEAQVLAAFSGPGIDRIFRDRLIAAMSVGETNLRKMLRGDADAQELEKQLSEQMEPLAGTFGGGSIAAMAPYRDAVRLVAMQSMATGADASTAVTEALKPLVGDDAVSRYKVQDGYRIPYPTMNDPDAIARGAAAIVADLPRWSVQPYGSADPVIQGVEGYRQESYVDAVMRDGQWVTSPGEDGLILLDGAGVPVLRDGEVLFVPWDGLIDTGNAAATPQGRMEDGVYVGPKPFGVPHEGYVPPSGAPQALPPGSPMGGEDDLGLLPEEYILGDLGYQRSDQPGFVMGGIASLNYGKDKAGPGQRDEPTAAERTAQMMARPVSPDMPGYARADVSRETLAAFRYLKDENPPPPRPGPKVTLPMPGEKPPMPADYAGATMPGEALAFPGYRAGMAIRMAPDGALKDAGTEAAQELGWRKEYRNWLASLPSEALTVLYKGAKPIATGGLVFPVATHEVRTDEKGHGEFHASRPANKGGLHQGVDILAEPGETVYAPITGTVTSITGIVYPGDKTYRYVEILTPDRRNVRLFYVLPGAYEGQQVTAGITPIGVAQDVSQKHGAGMKPHVHVEVREKGKAKSREGELVDPWPLFNEGEDVGYAMMQAEVARRGLIRPQLAMAR